MQIVININDNEYLGIKNYPDNITSYPVTIHLYEAVRNGIPLPKCHGDLIDRNELNKDLITNEWITDYDGGGLEEILFNAPTIIEADNAESEGKV